MEEELRLGHTAIMTLSLKIKGDKNTQKMS